MKLTIALPPAGVEKDQAQPDGDHADDQDEWHGRIDQRHQRRASRDQDTQEDDGDDQESDGVTHGRIIEGASGQFQVL